MLFFHLICSGIVFSMVDWLPYRILLMILDMLLERDRSFSVGTLRLIRLWQDISLSFFYFLGLGRFMIVTASLWSHSMIVWLLSTSAFLQLILKLLYLSLCPVQLLSIILILSIMILMRGRFLSSIWIVDLPLLPILYWFCFLSRLLVVKWGFFLSAIICCLLPLCLFSLHLHHLFMIIWFILPVHLR